MAADRILMGIILGAHGVRGAVRLKSFAAEPESFRAYGPLQDRMGKRSFRLEPIGQTRGAVLAKIDGVTDRDQADALKGIELYLSRTALPPVAPDEFYQADLIGLQAELADGTALGRVTGVLDYGQGDMLEIAGEKESLVIPFTHQTVPSVDLAQGRIVVSPPPGLVEPAEPGKATP